MKKIELRETKAKYESCKTFCPRENPEWKEYQEWWKEKHKDDIQ